MYTLGTGIWRKITQKISHCIVIVGLDNAGKTTFLEQIKTKLIKGYQKLNPSRITSTVGLNLATIEIDHTQLNFWDLGGQSDLQCLWDKYFDDCQALIFVIDACDISRFDEVEVVFKRVMDNEIVQKLPILVVCNKSDLKECTSADQLRRIITDDRHRGDLALLTVSALHDSNVDRCVRWLCTVLANSVKTVNGFVS